MTSSRVANCSDPDDTIDCKRTLLPGQCRLAHAAEGHPMLPPVHPLLAMLMSHTQQELARQVVFLREENRS
jgi:hypothetical protein